MLTYTYDMMQTRVVEDGADIKAGEIVQLVVVNGEVAFTRSNGKCPFGVAIMDAFASIDVYTTNVIRQCVATSARFIGSTDKFERSEYYPVGANLYCSETGQFTTRRPSPIHPVVGAVIERSGDVDEPNATLRFLWY